MPVLMSVSGAGAEASCSREGMFAGLQPEQNVRGHLFSWLLACFTAWPATPDPLGLWVEPQEGSCGYRQPAIRGWEIHTGLFTDLSYGAFPCLLIPFSGPQLANP